MLQFRKLDSMQEAIGILTASIKGKKDISVIMLCTVFEIKASRRFMHMLLAPRRQFIPTAMAGSDCISDGHYSTY